MPVIPVIKGNTNRRIVVQASLGNKAKLYLKDNQLKQEQAEWLKW
jgi:hypothetical protein